MRVLRLLRQPIPLAVWLGQLFSVTGDKLYAMAVPWLVLQLTGSAKLMAAVSVAESVPYVMVGFLGASLITRSSRLRMMIRLDLLSAAVVAFIPVTYLPGLRSILLFVVVVAAASALEALFDPALQSALPDVVAGVDLQPMVALTDSTDRLARVLGPGSAGLLLLVMPEIHLFSLDAGTFLMSAAALAFVARRAAFAPPSPNAPAEPRATCWMAFERFSASGAFEWAWRCAARATSPGRPSPSASPSSCSIGCTPGSEPTGCSSASSASGTSPGTSSAAVLVPGGTCWSCTASRGHLWASGSLLWQWPPRSGWRRSQPCGWASSPRSATSAWTPTSQRWFHVTACRGCTRSSESWSLGLQPWASSQWPLGSTQCRVRLLLHWQEHGCYWWGYSLPSGFDLERVSKTPLPRGHLPAFRP